jgi:hypothetical protein
MTDVLERPALVQPASPGLPCPPHVHTARCWWHAELAGWVCSPSRTAPSRTVPSPADRT